MDTVMVIPDTHVPFHDVAAWELVLKVRQSLDPDKVVFIGDFADFFSISSHSKDPTRKQSLAAEVEQVNAELDKVTAKKEVFFLEGNHEDRLRRYLQDKAPELFGLADTKSLFKIKDRGWRFVQYKDYIRIGKVAFTHDVGRSGKYGAFHSLTDFGGNIVFGHSHRGCVVYQGEMRGKQHFALNVGWLGDLTKMDYMHKARAERDWQLGFGIVRIEENGLGHGQFVPIIKGTCVVDGKLYK